MGDVPKFTVNNISLKYCFVKKNFKKIIKERLEVCYNLYYNIKLKIISINLQGEQHESIY